MVVDKKPLSDGNKPKVMALSFNEQGTRIQDAISRRAYEIFACRTPDTGIPREDWTQAEAEMVKPLCCGLMPLGDTLWVEADAAKFEAGSIEIWVAARNITLCGKPSAWRFAANDKARRGRAPEMIFRTLELPVEIDPARITTKLRGPSLEILLTKKGTAASQKAKATAA